MTVSRKDAWRNLANWSRPAATAAYAIASDSAAIIDADGRLCRIEAILADGSTELLGHAVGRLASVRAWAESRWPEHGAISLDFVPRYL